MRLQVVVSAVGIEVDGRKKEEAYGRNEGMGSLKIRR
jgi:hypothetical protein